MISTLSDIIGKMSNGHLIYPMEPMDVENAQWTFAEVLDMYGHYCATSLRAGFHLLLIVACQGGSSVRILLRGNQL